MKKYSGKSSLLLGLLGELSLTDGYSFLFGNVSYAAQAPWLLAGTIQENILGGLPLDEDRYQSVLRVCSLLDEWDDMSLVELHERGSDLSGKII